jgi:hypothetical protein
LIHPGAGRAVGAVQAARAAAQGEGIGVKLARAIVQNADEKAAASGVRSGISPHERINSIADALRANAKGRHLSPEEYMRRAETYTRRGASYQSRANVGRDYPESY